MHRVSVYSRLGQVAPPPAPVLPMQADTKGITLGAGMVGLIVGAILGGFIGAMGRNLSSKFAPLHVRTRK